MLWRALRNHRIDGYGFRRQTPIGPYFADFVCLERKIVVEADGRTHETADTKVKDAERDAWFRRAGFHVLQFPDDLVIGGLPIVIERIRVALREPLPRRRSSIACGDAVAGHTPSGLRPPSPAKLEKGYAPAALVAGRRSS
jgi:very-short-patch-repair endonuclease